MTEQLKPCQFCNAQPMLYDLLDTHGGFSVECPTVGCDTDKMKPAQAVPQLTRDFPAVRQSRAVVEQQAERYRELMGNDVKNAQAVPVLTDDEVALIVADCAASAHRRDDFSFARAIEQAVRAKMGAGVGWQPIETAPKTSKAILVYCAERKNIYTANYGKVGGFLQADGWRHFGNGGDMTEAPTHWQPLPPPPGIVGKEGA